MARLFAGMAAGLFIVQVWLVGVLLGAGLTTAVGLGRATRLGAPFQASDGLLFGASGGLVGGSLGLLWGLARTGMPPGMPWVDAVLGALLWNLAVGAGLGALGWFVVEWRTTAAERARRDAGDLTLR